MRIVVNLLNMRPGRIGGTETYVRELVSQLPAAAPGDRVILLTSCDVAEHFAGSGTEVAALRQTTARICGLRFLEAGSAFRAKKIERAIARLQPDVVLYPQQCMFPAHVEAPSVLVVHDLYHVFHPQYLTPLQRWYRRRAYPAAARRADRLIAISDFTRRTMHRIFPFTQGRISVVPHGVRDFSTETIEPHVERSGPYVLYPAATLPHKNHEQLFRTVAHLRNTGRFGWKLLLTGQRTGHWKRLAKLVAALGLEGVVEHRGYLPYQSVLRLVRGAECVVFPSQFEGFGIPIIEAAALGTRVVTSRLDVFAEIGVPDECRIDFSDPEALARALAGPAQTTLLRQPWSWSDTARATVEVLRATVDTRGPAAHRRAA